jgi:hypothetical protein
MLFSRFRIKLMTSCMVMVVDGKTLCFLELLGLILGKTCVINYNTFLTIITSYRGH